MNVVNVRTARCTHYIGRGYYAGLVQAGLGNPFTISIGRSRAKAIEQFEQWARETPEVLERIKALPRDAVLGCWCKPSACHGDVIVKLWQEMHGPLPSADDLDYEVMLKLTRQHLGLDHG